MRQTVKSQHCLPVPACCVAAQVLEAYCNWLENRVVARFDAAVAEGNLRLQAQSVAIMIELDKERSIAQVGFAIAVQQHAATLRWRAGLSVCKYAVR
jgi:hypothetical protein